MVARINDRSVHRNFVGGAWVRATSSRRLFTSTNPSDTRLSLGRFAHSSRADIDAAVHAAREALPSWSRTPIPVRADYLLRMAAILERRKEEIAAVITQEIGKILTEARGDVQESIDVFRHMAGTARQPGVFGYEIPSEVPGKTIVVRREPVGVGAIISPWNFPTAILCWNIGPALLAGNTLVIKQSVQAPRTAEMIAQVAEEAGLPPGVLNIIQGDRRVGERLLRHPGINAISFTGSTAAGRKVKHIADAGNKRVTLELGGKNAIAVMADADPSLALEGALFGAFYTAGQRCTATSRLILLEEIADAFVERIMRVVNKIKVGDGMEDDTFMGPLVSATQLETSLRYVDIGRREGAQLLYGGERLTEGDLQYGHFMMPTVFDRLTPRMRIAREEIFGPVLAVIRVRSFAEAMVVYRDVEPGLSGSIYTRDMDLARRFVTEEADTGLRYVNLPPSGAEVGGPFGGRKATDLGTGTRESDIHAIHFWTEPYGSSSVTGRVALAQGLESPLAKLGVTPEEIGDRF